MSITQTIIQMIENSVKEGLEYSFWTKFSKKEYLLDDIEKSINLLSQLTNGNVQCKVSENAMLPNSFIVNVEWDFEIQ